MPRDYSPVDSDADIDQTPVRRFRLRKDGVARATSPLSPTQSPGPDNLDRAMHQFHSSFNTTPLSSRISASSAQNNAPIASPTPQRHGSVSSSSIPSRPPSTQETYVDVISPQNTQPSTHAPWNQQQQQQPHVQQSRNWLPPIPTSSPLYDPPAHSYSSFDRPFSSASGPQIVPVHTWDASRTNSAFQPSIHGTGNSYMPSNAYSHVRSATQPVYSYQQQQQQHQQPVRNSYMSGYDPYQQSVAHTRSPSPEEEEEEEEEEEDDDPKHRDARHSHYSSVAHDADGDLSEKPPGGYDMTKYEAPEAESPEVDTKHYGPAPVGQQARRRKTKKKIPLTQGHMILDLHVPTRLVQSYKNVAEMAKTRYTAVTCDPDEFVAKRFSLRQVEMGRQTELFICITMYNENEVLFCRTLYGVMKNIAHLVNRKSSRVWGPDSWKKVVVCIIADGRRSVHPRVLDCLTALGVYQGEHMKNMVNGKPVEGHMFEYTCGFGIDPELHFKYPDKGIVPTQVIFLMKERNQRKINSHRWFFNAFGAVLQPNVCVLLDVGTRPGANSLYRLWKAFDMNSNVGGACGEIAAYKGPWWTYLLNPLVASQNFEYKMSNILDKPCESMFGYISVLPGAFSAYRYIALQNDKSTGIGPLASYFKGEVLQGRTTDIFTSNMYLAEDRILSFEVVAKANSNWILKYVKASVGETDVPDALDELIVQRRRWLNGSFFAAVYSLAHIGQILTSGHSLWRKLWLSIESIYNAINLVFAWFAIGNYCLFFVILTSSIEDPVFKLPPKTIHFANLAAHYILATIVMACFLFSMGNRPRASPWKYNTAAGILAVLTGYMVACGIMCAVRATSQAHHTAVYRNMVFSILITYGTWFMSSVMALDPWHLITCMAQYTLLSPIYLVMLNIYAFANLDDITWGTKGADLVLPNDLGNVVQDSQHRIDLEISPEAPNDLYVEALDNLKTRKPPPRAPGGLSETEKEQARRDYYANLRTNLLLAWALSNAVLVVCILSGVNAKDTFGKTKAGEKTRAYMTFVLAFVAITNIIRFLGSTLFMITVAITG